MKETKLTASALSSLFIAFSLMTLIPGYPILVGAFFVCFGVFQTFQSAREANDTLYTAMLPVAKSDVVRSKYIFTIFIQFIAFLLMTILTVLRMTLLSNATPYISNPMMNANLAYLGYVLLVYSIFNIFFLGGFFKTAYKIANPFLSAAIFVFLMIGIGEILHHIPGLEGLNATGFAPIQCIVLACGIVVYVVATLLSLRISIQRFQKIDL